MAKINLSDVLTFIYNQSTAEDRRAISEAFNSVRKDASRQAAAGLSVGDLVEFFSEKQYRTVRAKVTKINRMTIHCVDVSSGTRWRCSPGLVKKVTSP